MSPSSSFFAVLLALSCAAGSVAASSTLDIYTCIATNGVVTYLPHPAPGQDCQITESRPVPALLMVYQDETVQVLAEPATASRQGNVVQVALVRNYIDASLHDGLASVWQQVQAYCTTPGSLTVLQERGYSQSLARGAPDYEVSWPGARPKPITPGTPDAMLHAVLCSDG